MRLLDWLRFRFLSTAMLALVAFTMIEAAAPGEAYAQRAPGGPYTRDCNKIRIVGADLRAICYRRGYDNVPGGNALGDVLFAGRRDGKNVVLRNYQECASGISYDGASLNCRRHTAGDASPSGSYRSACRATSFSGPDLHASCSQDGLVYKVRLANYRACGGRDIYFANRKLGCR